MSACVAPPNHPDPFRSGLHPTRDLGSPTWRVQSARPQAQPQRAVVQLTQEEDQAVTNLLKLHHQEAPGGCALALQLDLSGPARLTATSPEEAHEDACVDARGPKLKWRRRQLEADPPLSGAAAQRDASSVTTPNKTPPKYETLSEVMTFDEGSEAQRSLNSKKRSRLTELEEDAVFVLLKLGDAVTSESLR